MRALTYKNYGPPSVVELTDEPLPKVGPKDVLVNVRASGVNTGDWRIRAAAFPGILSIPGRLMFGLLKPRNRRLGTEFAGTVETVGEQVSNFRHGERVYGFAPRGGASADYLVINADVAIAPLPEQLSFEQGAALPFGGLAALVFLTQFGSVVEGQDVLIIGASGGVGVYAVQIAKALKARVTGVSGPANTRLVKNLGADRAIDYHSTDIAKISDRFDVILDTVGAIKVGQAFGLLKASGVYLPMNMGLREMSAALFNPFRNKKIRLAVNDDTAQDLLSLNQLIEAGQLKPVIDSVYPLAGAVDAHERVQGRHKAGAIVLRH